MKNKIKDKIKQKSINVPNKDVEKQKKEIEKEDYMKTSQFLDKVPNNNLFKNDGKYSINYLLEFKYEEEDNSMKDLIVATFFQNQIACIFILYSRFFLLNISNLFNGYSFFENNIYIHLFSLVISFTFSQESCILFGNFVKSPIKEILIPFFTALSLTLGKYKLNN